ncbi:MAG: hypothetical protein K6T31_07345, partial [Alicyclobacillus sp.]|nr:hypothetical protein [Alicyclobacillus sp.]
MLRDHVVKEGLEPAATFAPGPRAVPGRTTVTIRNEQTCPGHTPAAPRLVCLGELLVDLVPEATDSRGGLPWSYRAHLGGAPANV